MLLLLNEDAFDIRSLFTAGEQGIWLDPSDFSTLFQDSAGTTPVTAVGQPVGLALDKRLGLALGAELVTNGDFDNADGWVLQSEVSISSGSLNFNSTAARTATATGASCVSGRWYLVEFDLTFTSGIPRFDAGGGSTNISATTGHKKYIRQATGTNDFFFTCSSGGGVFSVDNPTVRELPGNHASQTTSASRPTVEALVNLLTRTEELDHADWAKYGVTVTANAGVGYDGIMNLDKVMEVAAASVPRIVQARPTTIGKRYVAYFDAKAAERTQIRIVAEGSVLRAAYYNLSTGAVISQGGSASAYISSLGNGLYRCWMSYTATAAVSSLYVTLAEAGSTIPSGDPTKGVFLGRADFREESDMVYPYQKVNTATDYVDVGAPRYLQLDGTDDGMATPSIDFTGTDKMTVWAGVRKLSDAAAGIICELSANRTANNGAFSLVSSGAPSFLFASKGTLDSTNTVTGNASPISRVLTGIGDIAGDKADLRVNGSATPATTDQGTGNYGNYPLYIGRRGGTTLPFNGRIYQLIVRGAESNAGQIAAGEAWCNAKARAY